MMRNRLVRNSRSVVLALGIAMLSGCTSWRVRPEPPDAVIASEKPGIARFTTVEGACFTLRNPAVSDGQVTGERVSENAWGERVSEPCSVPLETVAQTELPEFDGARTAYTPVIFAIGLFAVAAVAYFVIPDSW
jgi:hypothetical protein